MDNQNAEQAAFTMMSEASHGQDISRRYNSLTSEEQKQVFSEMKDLKMNSETSRLFGNVDLFDSDNDGRMDDARWAGRNGISRDVYDSNADRVADNSTRRQPANGYERVQAQLPADENVQQPRSTENLRRDRENGTRPADENVQSRFRYGENGAGNRNHEQGNRRDPNSVEDRLGRSAEHTLGRAGQILVDEGLRGIHRGSRNGPGVGDRIERRMEQMGRTETNRVLRDITRGVFRRN